MIGDVRMSRGHDEGKNGSQKGSRTGRKTTKASRDNRSRQLNPKDSNITQKGQKSSSSKPDWRGKVSAVDAQRIQSHADKSGTNQDFKQRAQRASERNQENGNVDQT